MANNIFMPVEPLIFWTQLAVPTIYGDSLSYLEDIGKVRYKLNEVIGSLNAVPAMVDKKIEDAFDDSGIEQKIKDILAAQQLNVKNPPEGLTPAVGDGAANDTAAIQAIINYAKNTGVNTSIYIPSGTYLVSGLTLPAGVSLIGENMYTTTIKLANYANKVVIAANLNESVIGNLTIDTNSTNNSEYKDGLTVAGQETWRVQNVRFVNLASGQSALSTANNGVGEIIDIIVSYGTTNVYVGTGSLLIKGMVAANCQTALNIECDHTILANGYFVNCTNDVAVASNNNVLHYYGTGKLTNTGESNSIISQSQEAILYYRTANVTMTEAYLTLTNGHLNATGTVEAEIGELDLTVTGDKITSASTSMETVTNGKTADYGDYTEMVHGTSKEQVTGDKILIAGDAKIQTGAVAATVQSMHAKIAGEALASASRMSLYGADSTVLKSKQITLDSDQPVIYREAQKLNDNYNYIPFTAPNGDTVQVLVFNGTDPTPPGPEPSETPIYINVKDLGAVGDGVTDDTQAFNNAGNRNGYIFVPYGTYLVQGITLNSGIKGIIGEMSTIKNTQNSGVMINGGSLVLNSLILDAPDAENAVFVQDSMIVSSCVIRGHVQGNIIMSDCKVNNSSNLKLGSNANIANSQLNANIVLSPGGSYTVSGNKINGSFVLNGVTAQSKIGSLTITGNVFTAPTSISDTYVTNLRIAGNVLMSDYPVTSAPDPWDYTVPADQPVTYQDLYRTLIDANGKFVLQKYNDTAWDNVLSASGTEVFIPTLLQAVKQILTPDRPMQFLPTEIATYGVQIVATTAGASIQTAANPNTWGEAFNIYSSGILELIKEVQLRSSSLFTFKDKNGVPKFRIYCNSLNNFVFQIYLNNTWESFAYITQYGLVQINANVQTTAGKYKIFENSSGQAAFRIYCDTNTNTLRVQSSSAGGFSDSVIFLPSSVEIHKNTVFKNDTSIRFFDPTNTFTEYEMYSNSVHRLVLRKRDSATGTWYLVWESESDGTVKFNKPIIAPNIGTGGMKNIQEALLKQVTLSSSTIGTDGTTFINTSGINAKLLYVIPQNFESSSSVWRLNMGSGFGTPSEKKVSMAIAPNNPAIISWDIVTEIAYQNEIWFSLDSTVHNNDSFLFSWI